MHGEFDILFNFVQNKDHYVFPIVLLQTEKKHVGASLMVGTFTSCQSMSFSILECESQNMTPEYGREIIILSA